MRAVIFDLDGTLVDTVYGHTHAWQRVLAVGLLPSAFCLQVVTFHHLLVRDPRTPDPASKGKCA